MAGTISVQKQAKPPLALNADLKCCKVKALEEEEEEEKPGASFMVCNRRQGADVTVRKHPHQKQPATPPALLMQRLLHSPEQTYRTPKVKEELNAKATAVCLGGTWQSGEDPTRKLTRRAAASRPAGLGHTRRPLPHRGQLLPLQLPQLFPTSCRGLCLTGCGRGECLPTPGSRPLGFREREWVSESIGSSRWRLRLRWPRDRLHYGVAGPRQRGGDRAHLSRPGRTQASDLIHQEPARVPSGVPPTGAQQNLHRGALERSDPPANILPEPESHQLGFMSLDPEVLTIDNVEFYLSPVLLEKREGQAIPHCLNQFRLL
ncbi:uncharacterized protein LOC113219632 [Piliocolobus tephrosceles]|uniref:uncharacterized protein LOC113219632 n=1 Tax=Piliocolobus tephrosceles TaxID=591936 RepID=UPI000E6AF021|nr:uncharacterized protein LOC113219632 [Piliocolobus tephrosceles]